MVRNGTWRPGVEVSSLEPEPERDGFPADDKRWRVWWLKELLNVPADATWPRLMSLPNRRAVDSLGPDFCDWAEQRSGRPLRWWQRLVAYRLLEVDQEERLVWETCVLSCARQCGKSWLLRGGWRLWRIHNGERFGEPQDVVHTGMNLSICKEVQRPAMIWAKPRPEFHLREVNGQESLELRADGSRWMLRAREAVYGLSASMAMVDEAWKVRAATVDEALQPTMVERSQAQLLLVSTAHRRATALMLGRRQTALAQLEIGDDVLLIEWSAPHTVELDDRRGWRLASPHWSTRRERMIAQRHQAMLSGEVVDPEEPDPQESFASQWLNRWPRKLAEPTGATEPLLPLGLWDELAGNCYCE